jgi:hypothetical protein
VQEHCAAKPASSRSGGSWRKAPAWRSSQRTAQVYKSRPKSLHSATSAKPTSQKVWKQVTESPGTKTCNGRAAVSWAAMNQTPAANINPKTTNHAYAILKAQKCAKKQNPIQTSQPAQHIPKSGSTSRRGPSARRKKEQGGEENTCKQAKRRRTRNNPTKSGSGTKQQQQPTSQSKQPQGRARTKPPTIPNTNTKPKAKPCNNVHKARGEHAADPERRARRKDSKGERKQPGRRTL